MYTPSPLGDSQIHQEFQRLAAELRAACFPYIILEELNAAPSRPVEGMTVLADGTNWNPGSGAGVYTYYGSGWNKLG